MCRGRSRHRTLELALEEDGEYSAEASRLGAQAIARCYGSRATVSSGATVDA